MSKYKQQIKLFRQKTKDSLKIFKRVIRTTLKSPVLAKNFLNFRSSAKAYDWIAVKKIMNEIAEEAYRVKDHRLLKDIAYSYRKFLDMEAYTYWEHKYEELSGNLQSTRWLGEDLSNSTLWISFKDTEKQGISIGMNLVGHINAAKKRAKYTVLVVDSRLVQIFSRTFPEIEVLSGPVSPAAKQGTSLVTANSLVLRLVLGTRDIDLNYFYVPLIPDKIRVNSFHSKYRNNNSRKLLFGISWGSFSTTKLRVPLDLWIDLIQSINATFVVTQYRYSGFSNDLEVIMSAAPERVIFDKSVNQLLDMDNFAAQLSSLDALISVSSSDTYFSGALGIPTFMTCDDLFRSICPVEPYNEIPWCPDSTLYGKSGREWSLVFRDLKNGLIKKYGQTILINQM